MIKSAIRPLWVSLAISPKNFQSKGPAYIKEPSKDWNLFVI